MVRFPLIASIFLFVACDSAIFTGDDVLAEVGKYRLYRSDLSGLFEGRMTYEDSIAVLKSYVDTWVSQKSKLLEAERSLGKDGTDVGKELDDYRTSLLVYRWENEYMDRRLDTTVSENESRAFYNSNLELFRGTESVVAARCIMIDSKSPYLKRLQIIYDSEDVNDNDEIKDICYKSAYRYSDFDMRVVGLSKVASFLRISSSEAESIFSGRRSYITRDSIYTYLVHLFERIPAGEILPYEYVEKDIRDRVLASRKRTLLGEMENEALKKAYRNNEIKVYIDEND